MKKQILAATLFVSLSFLLGSCQSKPDVKEGEYLIEGTLSNVPDGSIIKLTRPNGRVMENIAVDTLRNGRFSFHDTISVSSQNMAIMSDSEGFPSTWLSFWVGSGKRIEIKGENTLLRTWTVACDLPEQEAEKRFTDVAREDWRRFCEILILETQLSNQRMENKLEISQEEYRAKMDSLQALIEPVNLSILQKEMELMKKEPISHTWLDRMRLLAFRVRYDENFQYKEETKQFFARMTDADKQTPIGKEISDCLEEVKKVNVGDAMADANLFDLDGKEHHLADLAGKYILLDFWSSGCGPCLQAIPEMKEIAKGYADKLHVVSISTDTESMWQKASAELELDGLNWNEFKGNNGLAASYQVYGIPHYVMIDSQGKIIDVWSGYATGTLKEKVKGLVK